MFSISIKKKSFFKIKIGKNFIMKYLYFYFTAHLYLCLLVFSVIKSPIRFSYKIVVKSPIANENFARRLITLDYETFFKNKIYIYIHI